MTYTEKMAEEICMEAHRAAAAIHYFKSQHEARRIVNQIIADTKAACLESIRPFNNFSSMHHGAYVEAIEKAEVKEQ